MTKPDGRHILLYSSFCVKTEGTILTQMMYRWPVSTMQVGSCLRVNGSTLFSKDCVVYSSWGTGSLVLIKNISSGYHHFIGNRSSGKGPEFAKNRHGSPFNCFKWSPIHHYVSGSGWPWIICWAKRYSRLIHSKHDSTHANRITSNAGYFSKYSARTHPNPKLVLVTIKHVFSYMCKDKLAKCYLWQTMAKIQLLADVWKTKTTSKRKWQMETAYR